MVSLRATKSKDKPTQLCMVCVSSSIIEIKDTGQSAIRQAACEKTSKSGSLPRFNKS